MNSDRDLVVGPLAQRAAVLPGHPTDMSPSSGTDTSPIAQATGSTSGSIRSPMRHCTGSQSRGGLVHELLQVLLVTVRQP